MTEPRKRLTVRELYNSISTLSNKLDILIGQLKDAEIVNEVEGFWARFNGWEFVSGLIVGAGLLALGKAIL